MLHKVKNVRREIFKGLPELKALLSPSARKKGLLKEMATKELPRPSQKTKIGRSLSEYTSPSNRSYDRDFHREMKRLRPDWFITQTEIASQKKKELIRMAENGENRPSHDKTKLGQALSNYTRKSSPVYDPEFDREIRTLRPDWFDY